MVCSNQSSFPPYPPPQGFQYKDPQSNLMLKFSDYDFNKALNETEVENVLQDDIIESENLYRFYEKMPQEVKKYWYSSTGYLYLQTHIGPRVAGAETDVYGYWTDALYVLLDFTREYPGLSFTFKGTERGGNFGVANGAMRVRDDEDSG